MEVDRAEQRVSFRSTLRARRQRTSVKVETIRTELRALETNLRPQALGLLSGAKSESSEWAQAQREGQIVTPHMQVVLLCRRANGHVRRADNGVARLADIGAFVRVPAAVGVH
jgi:hypothetical protein